MLFRSPLRRDVDLAQLVAQVPVGQVEQLVLLGLVARRQVEALGAALALKGFVVLAIGGFGSMPGTLVGGTLVGLAEAYASRYLGGEFANLTVFLILITILMVRPAGLFVRTKERVV